MLSSKRKYNYSHEKLILSILIALMMVIPVNFVLATGPSDPEYDFDDCESSEVIVGDILSPPSIGMTGSYDITAEFTAVGIIMNGSKDTYQNEPWIEHELSPDNIGTPNVNFYTSCDDNYMYVAFENISDGIMAFELFIDKNANGSWDGPLVDKFFTAEYPQVHVENQNGILIPNSEVAWGNYRHFVEIKIPKLNNWAICNDWAFRVRSDDCESEVPECIVDLPPYDVLMELDNTKDDSFFKTTISGIEEPSPFDIENGIYPGWCLDSGTVALESPTPVMLYSSYCPPQEIETVNWSYINYVINNKIGSYYDIQLAIWYFIDMNPSSSAQNDIQYYPNALAMVNDAIAYGENFVPGPNQCVAVICDPLQYEPTEFQYTFIEVTVPDDECEETWNPSWGDNCAPEEPVSFLEFTCDYDNGYSCPCGVAFKALADIYEIVPGDVVKFYEIDFEDEDNVTNEWIEYSLDSQPDTWNLSETRSHSSSHSMHCTDESNYYGNAIDILQMKNPMDFSDVNNITFSFWHWCEGETYQYNGNTMIADYGDVEIYTYLEDAWQWVSLSDLGLSNLYYDNDWEKVTLKIETTKLYPYKGENISGADLLTSQTKFRFVWKSDPQFQYEGWYIDDIEIFIGENPHEDLSWQTHYVYWCVPFGSTIVRTFPMQWTPTKEGKYHIIVCVQEESPWCGADCNDKYITIGNIHDVAVTSLISADTIDKGDDLDIEAVVKNVGTYDETNVQVKATIKKDGTGTPVWQETVVIPTLNASESKTLNFVWEDATYCDHLLEVTAIHPDDEVPWNNSKSKWVIVATTLFEDDMDDECCWEHYDLTGGTGHWHICSSGYDDYLWCGIPSTTKYDNNWNDVAIIDRTFDFTTYSDIRLKFDTYTEIAQNDTGYVEISDDGGRHWYNVATFTGELDWTNLEFPLNGWGSSNQIMIRFRFFSNESITWRGWIIDDVQIIADSSTIFFEDFETGVGNWTIERVRAGDWWQRVVKAKGGDSGNMAWWCGDELTCPREYPPNLNNVLAMKESSAVDLEKAYEADVLFKTWYEIEDGDMGYLEISDDLGATWTELETYVGDSEGWVTSSADISSWVGEKVIIRFRFTSDNDITGEGWYVDDVFITAKLDFNPPETTCTLTGTLGLNNWYTSSVQIQFSATDDLSGVKATYYRLDGGSQTTYPPAKTVSSNGVHTIDYWSVDNVGNVEAFGTKSFKIDSEDPQVAITKPGPGIYWRDMKLWPILSFTLLPWTNTYIFRFITIEASANDNFSGVDRVEFYIQGVLKETDTTAPYGWLWHETAFFKQTIEVKAYDKAGNMNSDSKEVSIFNINLLGS